MLFLTTQAVRRRHFSTASSGFQLAGLIPQEDARTKWRGCWEFPAGRQMSRLTQLVWPAVVAATAPGPDHTLLGVNRVCVRVCQFMWVHVCSHWASYQWEGMGDFAVRGQLSSEAIGRKELVAVIVLDNLTHCFQGHGICIHLVRTHIVKGGGLRGVTFEVDKCNKQSE